MVSRAMVSGRLVKLVAFELLELAAFAVPTLVVMEQFAAVLQGTRYWLVVSCSVAYVACACLLVWVPVKVVLHRSHRLRGKVRGWRPVLMMCVLLSTLPSFSFSVAVTEVRKSAGGSAGALPAALPDYPVSLVLTCLILVDIMENLRLYPLRGSNRSGNDAPIQASAFHVTTVSGRVGPREEGAAAPQPARSPAPGPALPCEPVPPAGALGVLARSDPRAELFVASFVLWADTVEMVRVAGHPAVYGSGWLYPVYICSYVSLLRMALAPRHPLWSALAVLLQDAPFLLVRLGLIAALGPVTPVLGLCKNVLVTLSYGYFNFLTRLRLFSTFETSPF
ncbi:transmembrane protein 236 [Dasypus novemcinctus]|uniref:transmembrane protein 236 n=1 Tax=Dasypus novemcinctus TaxID=9361 RepID=UPI00265E2BFF|nr:transmembrane protein 236 [Dasypus novemcinctus]